MVSKSYIFRYTLANIGLWTALMAPVLIGMSSKLLPLYKEDTEQNLAIVLAVGAFVAMAANAIFGRLSDRTTARTGRRKPWIIGGSLAAFVGLLVIGWAEDVWTILAGWVVVQAGFNAALAALRALLPDQVPVSQRGTVSGFLGAAVGIGSLMAVTLANVGSISPFWGIVLPGIVGTPLILQFVFGLKEKPVRKNQVPDFDIKQLLGSLWVNPIKHPDFALAWISRFLTYIGIAMVITYQLLFVIRKFSLDQESAENIVNVNLAISTLILVAASFVGGWLSDKFKRRKVFVFLSALMMAGALYLLATATVIPVLFIAAAFIGFAQGVYGAVDLALVTDVLPNKKDAGKDLGVFNIADALPQTVAPAVAPLFLVINGPNNYTSLFVGVAIIAVLGALAILPVRGVR